MLRLNVWSLINQKGDVYIYS